MLSKLGHWILKMWGWSFEGSLPDQKKYIVAVIPHTTNWDFIIGVLTKWALKLPVNYIGKHQLFQFPHGFIFRALGGRPVDRTRSNNLVEQVSEIFNNEEKFIIALAPEGTRSKVNKIKTGFYHIAEVADIPIIPCGFDFRTRKVIFREPFYPTGNLDKDMKELMDFYLKIEGKHPELGIDEKTTW
jgi:1-acyl-sn-glycerol-3-phosphate acyltransferase